MLNCAMLVVVNNRNVYSNNAENVHLFEHPVRPYTLGTVNTLIVHHNKHRVVYH